MKSQSHGPVLLVASQSFQLQLCDLQVQPTTLDPTQGVDENDIIFINIQSEDTSV